MGLDILESTMYNSRVRRSKLKAAILAKIHKQRDGCWRFGNNHSYGKFYFDGKTVLAHHAAFEAFKGKKVPPGVHIMHSCFFRPCVNPEHLLMTAAAGRDLLRWMDLNDFTISTFAKNILEDYNTVYRWVRYGRKPRRRTAAHIRKRHPDCPVVLK